MSDSYKREINVTDVVANTGNPRQDFGDLEALGATFAANGGQPYTPIIVVPDGLKFRLVDGERRWRAMQVIGTQRCDALVFTSMADAEAAVAMMATDDSKGLTPQERMRGFQSMLALGVDDKTAAAIARTDAVTVRRVRKIAAEAPDQATLDGLIAAADDEFSPDERARIMKQCEYSWGDPEAEAKRIRNAHERARALQAIKDCMPDGVEYRTGEKPYNPEFHGLIYITRVASTTTAAHLARKYDGAEGLVAYEDGKGFALYQTASEDALDPKQVEMARTQRIRDEHKAEYDEVFNAMARFATEPWVVQDALVAKRNQPSPAARRPEICERVLANRKARYPRVFSETGRRILSPATTFAEDDDPGLLELCEWLVMDYGDHGLFGYFRGNTKVDKLEGERYARVYDACTADGWKPTETAKKLRDMCKEVKA